MAAVYVCRPFFWLEPMQLDRWIAFVILCISLIYGYSAFFVMDELLAQFLKRNPIWPSTFPKILSVLAVDFIYHPIED